ncbi:hypothetical protein K435DRAFT_971296 [Dendrothele bispora CBS 962.96]|uniref:Uncharacterized protein n=1 Tax=Dendrothele bispora (strain CBS 962.96) TaxID=1314807 RepID=A0A4S8L7P4_DENBC|nr:hypothetical protein K435DRAFT_971296 [Dendrothele bispora CBS 962.96]
MNPNFPPDLDIHPSSSSSSLLHPNPSCVPSSSSDAFNTQSQRKAIQQYGIAGRVWEAAYLLNLYLNPPIDSGISRKPLFEFDPPFNQNHTSTTTSGRTIIEVGSGSGLVASNVARSLTPGTELLVLTDLPEVCPLLEENLSSISAELREKADDNRDTILVRPLTWGNHQHALSIASELGLLQDDSHRPQNARYLTHILCSDLVYFPELLAPLLRTLIQLSSSPFVPPTPTDSNPHYQDPQMIISYKIRSLSKETPFWSAFGLWFSFEPVLVRPSPNRAAQGSSSILAEQLQQQDLNGTTPPSNAPNPNPNPDSKSPSTSTSSHSHSTPKSKKWTRLGSSLEGPSFVFTARRRPESFGWDVPEDDEDLIAGKGVVSVGFRDQGTSDSSGGGGGSSSSGGGGSRSRGDDTFESLLFMVLSGDGDGDGSEE